MTEAVSLLVAYFGKVRFLIKQNRQTRGHSPNPKLKRDRASSGRPAFPTDGPAQGASTAVTGSAGGKHSIDPSLNEKASELEETDRALAVCCTLSWVLCAEHSQIKLCYSEGRTCNFTT